VERRKRMSYKELVAQIEGLNEELSRWNVVYKQLKEQKDEVDHKIMVLHRKKWKLELLITPVVKLPVARPRKISIKEVEVIDVDKLTPAQVSAILALLKARETESDLNEEEVEELEAKEED
jgi:hypothetical protein